MSINVWADIMYITVIYEKCEEGAFIRRGATSWVNGGTCVFLPTPSYLKKKKGKEKSRKNKKKIQTIWNILMK